MCLDNPVLEVAKSVEFLQSRYSRVCKLTWYARESRSERLRNQQLATLNVF